MKLMRKRKPSLKTVLGVTKAKRQIKKSLGVYEVTKVINAPKNAERRFKRKIGLNSGIAVFIRSLFKLFK